MRKEPQFMHWKTQISFTEDFYLERSLGMYNRDHKGLEESGQSLPGRVISFSCSCLSAESTPHNFSLSSTPLKNAKMKKFLWLQILWRPALWAESPEPFLAGLCPWHPWQHSICCSHIPSAAGTDPVPQLVPLFPKWQRCESVSA